MDQLKAILIVLKKYHFWALCVVVLITTFVCWWTATSGLAGLYQTNKATIQSKFNDFKNLGTEPPNERVINKKVEQEAVLQQNVFRAWEVLYERQKNLSVAPPELGEEFKRRFEKLKPNEDLDLNSRAVYQNFIKLHLPTLVTLVDARRPAPAGKEPAPAAPINPEMPSNTEQQFIGVVDWTEGDYQRIVNRFEWQETPSTAEILLAQEDLWVYEALLRVIKNTNKDTNSSNAVVKSIETISIGKDAAGKATEDTVVRLAVKEGSAAGGPVAAPGAPPAVPTGAKPPTNVPPGAESGATVSSQEAALAAVLEGRYVDNRGMPLAPGGNGPQQEFKMMPIYLSLVVDQRQVPKLLVECANSTMPIEVSRIQLKAGETQVLDLGTMGGAGVGSVPKGGMATGGRARAPSLGTYHSGPSASGRMAPSAEGDNSSQVGQYDIPVDLVGVIYIYNPPNPQKLGMPAQSAEPAAPGSSVPAVPATPTAAGAPPATTLIAPPSNPKRTGT